jgi:hypothetical protein
MSPTAGLFERIINARSSWPRANVSVTASHEETREILIEEEPYQIPIEEEFVSSTTTTDSKGKEKVITKTEKRIVGYETCFRECNQHYSPWGRKDEGGGHFEPPPAIPADHKLRNGPSETRRVKTFEKTEELTYASWQEEGMPVMFPPVVVVNGTFVPIIGMDQPGIERQKQMKARLLAEGKNHDSDVIVESWEEVVGDTSPVKGIVDEEEYQCIQDKFRTCGGAILWGLCMILGWQAGIESFMRWSEGDVKIELNKKTAQSLIYRTEYGQRDRVAGDVAIHISERAKKSIGPKKIVDG